MGPTDTEASKDSDSAPGSLALREPGGSCIQFVAILVKLMINYPMFGYKLGNTEKP